MITLPERLPDETEKAYSAFIHYCGLGYGRSLAELGKLLGKSATWMEQWSSRYGWQERVKVYDNQIHHLIMIEQAKAHLSEIEALRQRSKGLADKLLEAAEAVINRVKAKAENDEIYINTQSLSAASNAIKAGLDIHSHGLGIDELIPKLKADIDAATEADDD